MSSPVRLTRDEAAIIEQHFHKANYEEIRLRSHAVILSNKGYSFFQIGDILLRSEQTIYRWIKAFHQQRIASLFPKTLNNQHASKLTRRQKQSLKKILSKPPSEYGIPKEFWDISSLSKYIKAEFGVEYESDESYRLIFLLHNYSFHLPDTFDRHRDERKIKKRMREIRKEVQPLMKDRNCLCLFRMNAG